MNSIPTKYNKYMEINYQKILDFMFTSGKRLAQRAGNIKDIGITKKDLTEEDIAIERGFKEIISTFGSDHVLYGEEEHNMFQSAPNVWTVDPISSTASFIAGKPHYSIVIAHLINGKAVFATVYDPAVDEMFTAHKDQGAFLNGTAIKVSDKKKTILLRESSAWKQPEITDIARKILSNYKIEENTFSMAVNYCWSACGRSDGVVSFTKDSFPEFAGSFIIQEAGGEFTNLKGESHIQELDRIFIGGNKDIYSDIFPKIKSIDIKK